MSIFSAPSSSSKSFVDPTQQRHRGSLFDRAERLSRDPLPVRGTAGVGNLLQQLINKSFENPALARGQDLLRGGRGVADRGVRDILGLGAGKTARQAAGAGQILAGNAPRAFAETSSRIDPSRIRELIDNNVIEGLVGAHSRDIVRGLTERDLPGVDQKFAATGGLGSTRRGVERGILQRGASDRVSDIRAQLQGGAYSQALDTIAGQEARDTANRQQTMLANQALQGALLSQGANIGTGALDRRLGAAGQLTSQDLARTTTGAALQDSALQRLMSSGLLSRGIEQEQLDEDYARDRAPYGSVEWLSSILGSPVVLNQAQERGVSPIGQALAGAVGDWAGPEGETAGIQRLINSLRGS